MPFPSRPLGITEQALWLHDRAMPLHFILVAQVEGCIDRNCLTDALAGLQQRHPFLRAKIALEANGTPYFVEQCAPIPCRIVSRQGETHWQTEAAWELTQPFDWASAPLIRVVWLQSPDRSELMLVCHHAIADGMTTAHLIRELLSLLNHPQQAVVSYPIPSPLEALLPHYQSAPMLQKVLGFGLLKWQQMWHRCYPKENPPLQVDAGYLTAEATAQLLHRCRQEGTTVHAAIGAAWLFAIALNHHPAEPTLRCFSPINLRPYLTSEFEQAFGLYIAPAQTTHPITHQTQFWQTARSLKSQLMRQVEATYLRKLGQQYEVLMSTQPSPEFVQQLFTNKFPSDVMVTNLGRVTVPQYEGNLTLKAIYGPLVLLGFAQERVCGVATFGDRLFYTVVHQASEAEAILVKQAMQLLQAASVTAEMTRSMAEACLPDAR